MILARLLHVSRWRRSTAGLLACLVLAGLAAPARAQQDRVLGREDIRLLGAGLRVTPARQTVPKDIATIVSTFLQAPNAPGSPLPPFAPDAVVKGTLRGPGFARPVEITTRPNTPFNLPPFSKAGLYSLDGIRLESGGEVLLYGTPESVEIEVIEKLLVTQVTARPLTAAEIREKGIVFDKTSFQAYNFTATFAVGASNPVPISFPVVLPRPDDPEDLSLDKYVLNPADVPKLPDLKTIIPDTLRIQTQIPNLRVVGFTLQVPALRGKSLQVPPIPGVVVIPGDIGFLNQFFNVTLLVGNVAPAGSNLVVSELRAEILLPAGRDTVPNSDDDPLRMARTETGESARVQVVVQAGPDGKIGTGDDVRTLAPGETGSAEYLVEGRREGTHVIEMQMTGTLTGLPVGPVTVTGRAAGTVLVRNPTFTLTFTHPDLINAGEPYTLDVTVTNTSESPANFVSLNLYPNNVRGATVVGDPSRQIEYIAPGDSATVTFDMVAQLTGPIYAAALDSDENVNGRFALKTSVGELGIPLSPDSLVLPKQARSLPADLRAAALGLLGKAWAVATAPAAALPPGVTRFSKQIVYDRAIELAEAGFRYTLGEPLPDTAWQLALDYTGNNFTRIPERASSPSDRGFREADAGGFDELRRTSVRGDTLARVLGTIVGPDVASRGTADAHRRLAEAATWRPGHVSVLVTGAAGAPSPFSLHVVDPQGRRMGGANAAGKILKEIPFADLVPLATSGGDPLGELALVSVPTSGEYLVRLEAVPARAGPYTVSVVLPDADGALRQLVFEAIDGGSVPAAVDVGGTVRVRFAFATGDGASAPPTSSAVVLDPAPRLLGVQQIVEADLLCGVTPAGRVIAALFSEEVTAASAQDRLDRTRLTNYAIDGNQVIGVALQPGRRIVYLALRDPYGPYVPRQLTVSGVEDRRGQAMAAETQPIVATVARRGAVLSGRVLRADGTPAVGADARTFVFVECPGIGIVEFGLSEKPTDGNGAFSWDYVPGDPFAGVYANRVVGFDPQTGDGRGVNFQVQRDGQRLEVNVVFLGRGTITGRTLDDDRQVLPKTALKVTSLTDNSEYGATSDENGTFAVSGVPVGNVVIEAVYVRRDAQTGAQLESATTTQSDLVPAAGAVVVRDLFLLRDTRRPPTMTFGSAGGLVLRGDGTTPVVDVPVIAYYAHGSQLGVNCPGGFEECPLASVRTAADGTFAFEELPSGQYRFETIDQVTLQKGEARAIVQAGAESRLTVLLGLGLGTVRGIVVGPTGQPVAGARVGGGLTLTTTDANGQFTLNDVPIGRREIVAVDDATNTRAIGFADLLRDGDQVNVTLVLPAVASVVGTVTTFAGAPAAGVKVFLIDCRTGCTGLVTIVGQTATNAGGQYAFTGVQMGRYRVSAFTSGFLDGNVTDVVVKFANQVVRGDVRFRGGALGRVRGRVLRAEANGGGDTPVRAAVGITSELPLIAGNMVGVGFTRVENHVTGESSLETGEFSLAGIWPGAFTLNSASVFSPEPISLPGRIDAPGQVVDLTVRLQATSRVTGRVVLPDGVTPAGRNVLLTLRATPALVLCGETPNGEAECVVQEQPGITAMSAVTDDEGRFEFVNVPARRFLLSASDPASGRIAEFTGDVRPGDTADVEVRLLARPTLRVVVRGFDSQPIANARVEVDQRRGFGDRTDDDLAVRLPTDANGVLVLTGDQAPVEGEFTALATDRDGGGFSGRAAGRIRADDDGRTVTLDVYLFNATGTVTGTVFRADGFTVVPNAEVTLSNGAGALAFAVTDGSGTYRVETVPIGAFTVDVFEAATARQGYATGSIDIAGREVTLNVTQFGLGLVKGTVLESTSLSAVRGATVTLDWRLPSGRSAPFLTSVSDPDGRFYFPGVAQGSFRVSARKSYETPLGTRTAIRQVSGELDRDGQVVDLPVLLAVVRPQFGRVEGTVLTAVGGPSPFAEVRLFQSGTLGGDLQATTADGSGRFAFDQVQLGRVRLEAQPQVGAFERGTGVGELAFEGDTARVDLILRGTSSISGTVYQADGSTPAAFAPVFLEGQPTHGCEQLSPPGCPALPGGEPDLVCLARARRGGCYGAADASGRFSFPSFTGQTFTVTADGIVTTQKAQAGGSILPGQALDLRLVLSPVGRVTGRVLGSAGTPLQGVVAELDLPEPPTSPDRRFFVGTDADGRFAFDAVEPGGPYDLALADPLGAGVARRVVNVAAATLDLGDVVLDDAPPSVALLSPRPGATGVPRESAIRIVFNEPIARATVTAANIVLSSPTAAVAGLFEVEPGDAAVVFRPLAPLVENARYAIAVRNVADLYGKVMAPFTATFTTVDLTAPAIVSLGPAAGASGVPTTSTVRVQYSEPIDPTRFGGAPIVLRRGAELLEGTTDYLFGNSVIVFTPRFPLLDDTQYDLAVLGATDLSGNTAAPLGTTFRTTDRTPPQLVSLTAANGGRVIEQQVVDVTAEAGAAFDVAFVDFYVNGVLTGTDRQAPFVFPLLAAPSIAVAGQVIQVSAIATDTSGNRGTTPVSTSVEVLPDQPPSVTIDAPADGVSARNGERITVSVRGADDVGLTQIGYRAETGRGQDAGVVALDPPAPARVQAFAFNVPQDAAAGSVIRVTATVRDTRGQTHSAAVGVTVLDAVNPTVAITGTASGARVTPGSRVQVIVSAADPGGVRSVSFAASGAATANETRTIDPALPEAALAFALDVPPGAQAGQVITLTASATDASGNVGTAATVPLAVADQAPPTLVLRTGNGRLEAVPGASLTLIADAEDQVGVSRIAVRGDGAFAFSDAKSFSPALGSASASFTFTVPANAVPGSTVTVTGSAVDLFGNASDPVTLLLTVRTVSDVSIDPVIVLAGETIQAPITLSSPAPAGGLLLTFQSRNAGVATAGPTVTVPEGATSGVVPVTGHLGGSAQIDVLVQGVVRGAFSVTVRGGVVRGTVSGPQGPAAGVAVSVSRPQSTVSTTTDANGRYLVADFGTNGGVTVRASDPATGLIGYATGAFASPAGTVTIDVVLVEAGRVAGTVRRADGQTPAGGGVRVDIYAATNLRESLGFTFTADDGGYEFPLVTLGSYTLEASDVQGNRGRASATLDQSGEEAELDLQFLARGSVTGRVLSGGAPVPNVPVTLRTDSVFGPSNPVTRQADLDGRFRFDGVFAGTFTVQAIDEATNAAGTATGAVAADGEVVERDVTLAEWSHLDGRVLRADQSTPVPGARVTISTTRGAFATTSGTDGSFEFLYLPLGSYVLVADDRDGSGSIGRVTGDLTTPFVRVTRDVPLLAQASIVATVTDATGNVAEGARVTVTVQNGQLSKSAEATTDATGIAILQNLIVGSYSVSARRAGLTSGSVSGTLTADEVEAVSLQLRGRASIAGTVFAPDGATPVTGGFVRTFNTRQLSPVPTVQNVGADGRYRLDDLDVRTPAYRAYYYDTFGRLRGESAPVVLDLPGEVEVADITSIGAGTVAGQVLDQVGVPVGSQVVTVQALDPKFGNLYTATTNAAGLYSVDGVVAGPVLVTVVNLTRQLAGEATGTMPAAGGTLTLNVALSPNAIQMPNATSIVTRYDANGVPYDVRRDLQIWPSSSIVSPYYRFSGGGGSILDVTVDAATTRFAGQTFVTQEDGGREIVAQQTIGGLSVVRKLAVPKSYFSRALEILTNTTASPITVGVTVSSRLVSLEFGRTSSGDTVFDVAGATPDRWVVARTSTVEGDVFLNTGGFGLALNFDGANAPVRAASLAASRSTGVLSYAWTMTLAPGETAALLHFTAPMYSNAAGEAAAARLDQVPPEALAGLSAAELALVRNWALPANGQSLVEPLPALGGTVTGRLYEHDGTTPSPVSPPGQSSGVVSDTVTFRSNEILFGRTYKFQPAQSGIYTFANAPIDTAATRAVPLAPFTLRGVHPWSRVESPPVVGAFSPGETTAGVDVVFGNTAIVQGTVRRHTGTPVSSGTVSLYRNDPPFFSITNVPVSTLGAFTVFGAPSIQSTLSATLSMGFGQTALTGMVVFTPPAGQRVTQDVILPATGRVTGVLTDAAGNVVAGRQLMLVQVQNFNIVFQRDATTNTGGQFTFEDVPAGNYILRANDPVTGLQASANLTVVADQTTVQNLSYLQTGTIEVEVRLGSADGPPLQGAGVSLRLAGDPSFSSIGSTDANGLRVATNRRLGTYEVRAQHPQTSAANATVPAVLSTHGQVVRVVVVLPPVGFLNVNVRTSSGAGVANVPVTVRFGPSQSLRSDTTNSGGFASFSQIFGDYTVTASVPGLSNYQASATGTITENLATVNVVLTLPPTGSVTGRVVKSDGTTLPANSAYVELSSRFTQDYVYLGADGTFSFPLVPVGTYLLKARDYNGTLFAFHEGQLASGENPSIELVLDDTTLPRELRDGNGASYNALDQLQVGDPSQFGFRRYISNVAVAPNGYTQPSDLGAELRLGGRELRIRKFIASGVTFEKRLFVPADGYFARYVEILENTGDTTVTVTLNRHGISGIGSGTFNYRISETSDGDAVLSTADRWVRTTLGTSNANPLVSVFAGEGGAAPTLVSATTVTRTQWDSIPLAPGERVAFLFLENVGGSPAVAERLVQLPPEVLVGLTAEDRAAIVNFVVPEESALAPFPTIRGSVTFGPITPARGAQVTVTASNPFLTSPRTVTADAAGAYAMTYPVVSGYTVRALDPATAQLSAPVSGTLTPGQTDIVANLVFATVGSGVVMGRVLNEGLGVAGATVTLERWSPSRQTRTTTTDASGAYQFESLLPGSYALVTTGAPGTVPQANFLTETDGQLITRDLHVLSRTGTLTVDVFGFDGATRLTDAQVRVNDVANGYAFLGYRGAADAGGRYVFDAISHSSSGMQVLVQTPNGAASAEALVSFPAAGTGQSATVSITLAVGVLTGRVLDADGTTPVANAWVRGSQLTVAGQVTGVTGTTNADGRFSIAGLVAGALVVRATPSGGILTAEVGTTVPAASPNADVELRLPPSATIVGTVRDAAGAPIEFADVYVASVGGEPWESVYGYTDASGAFRVERVPLGGFTLQACEPNYENCPNVMGEVLAPGEHTVNVTLPATGTVTAEVTGPQGPAPDTWVRLRVSGSGPGYSTELSGRTDATGVATFATVPEGVAVGTAIVPVDEESDLAALSSVPVSAGESAFLELVAEPGPLQRNWGVYLPDVGPLGISVRAIASLEQIHGAEPFAYLSMPRVNGNYFEPTDVITRQDQSGITTAYFTGHRTGPLDQSRSVLVLPDGSVGFADIFENTGASDVTIDVDLASGLADPVEVLVAASSTGGTYQVTGLQGSATRGVVAQVFASTAPAALRPSLVGVQTLGGTSTVRYRLTIPAGHRRTLLSFAVIGAAGQATAVTERAEVLRALGDPAVFPWLFSLGPGTIVNFPVSGGGEP